MTLWHKRLTIFLIKIFGAIIGIAIISLFLYYHLYFKKDNLIKYVPKNAVLYSTFRLNSELKENEPFKKFVENVSQNYSLPEINFDDLNYLVAYNAGFALIPKIENNNLAFDFLLILNLKQNPKNVETYFNLIKKYNLHATFLTNEVLERNILVISSSNEVINEVEAISRQESPSLAENVNVVFNLSKFDINNAGRIFLNLDYLTNNLDKINNPATKLFLASLKTKGLSQLYLAVQARDNKIIVHNLNPENNFSGNQPLLEKIPDNFALDLNFNDGSNQFKQIIELLARIEPVFFNQVKENRIYLEGIYNFSLEKDILPFFAGQAQIVTDSNNHYILAVKVGQIPDLNSKINKLEDIIKNYFAYSFPKERQKQMPDYTYITQIVKDTSDFNFIEEPINGVNLREIKRDNLDLAYFVYNNVLYLANSREILAQFLTNQGFKSLAEISPCYSQDTANYSQEIIINSNYLGQFQSLFKNIGNFVIKGDLDKDSKIWLCLD